MKRSPELEAVTRRFWDAFVAQDGVAIGNLAASDSDLRFILLADDEWLTGRDAFRYVMVQRAREMEAVRVEFDRLEAYENGDTGWAAASITLVRSSGEPLAFRTTLVMLVESGMWRVAHMHSSRGVPNVESFGDDIASDLDDLVASVDVRTAETLMTNASSGTVTLMFTDIVDSTVMSEELGDDAWTLRLGEHLSSLHQIVEVSGGTVVKTLGDGAMIVFPSVSSALSAAVSLQRAAAAAGLGIRVGIHTGDAVHTAGDFVGTAVNKAARIASAAHGEEILVSGTTADMAGSHDFVTGEERESELKGLKGIHRLVPIIWT